MRKGSVLNPGTRGDKKQWYRVVRTEPQGSRGGACRREEERLPVALDNTQGMEFAGLKS